MDQQEFDLAESSGKFTTNASKAFLQRTEIPIEFLRLCADNLGKKVGKKTLRRAVEREQMYRGLKMNRKDRYLLMSLVQKEFNILDSDVCRFKNEINVIDRTIRVAEKVVDWIGTEHWGSFLKGSKGYNGIGVCPNHKCQMLIFKFRGCQDMGCFCGKRFLWREAMLDMVTLSEAYNNIKIQKNNNRIRRHEYTNRLSSEFLFRRQLLETAHEILFCSLQRRDPKRQRPCLNTENHNDIIETIRRNDLNRFSSPFLSRIEEENAEDDNKVVVLEDPRSCCNTLLRDASSFSIVDDDDEMSSSVFTSFTTPSDTVSLCDYIVVSIHDNDDGARIPSLDEFQDGEEDQCSYSLLSGCETVHSLDEELSNVEIGATSTTTGLMLSYCKVAKLGDSISSRNAKKADRVERTPIERNYHTNKKVSSTAHTDEMDCGANYPDDDDFLWSLYDAAKSCHGGRVSSRFRGNSRTSRPFGWGNQRRPNWSRKRRKDYKKALHYSPRP